MRSGRARGRGPPGGRVGVPPGTRGVHRGLRGSGIGMAFIGLLMVSRWIPDERQGDDGSRFGGEREPERIAAITPRPASSAPPTSGTPLRQPAPPQTAPMATDHRGPRPAPQPRGEQIVGMQRSPATTEPSRHPPHGREHELEGEGPRQSPAAMKPRSPEVTSTIACAASRMPTPYAPPLPRNRRAGGGSREGTRGDFRPRRGRGGNRGESRMMAARPMDRAAMRRARRPARPVRRRCSRHSRTRHREGSAVTGRRRRRSAARRRHPPAIRSDEPGPRRQALTSSTRPRVTARPTPTKSPTVMPSASRVRRGRRRSPRDHRGSTPGPSGS